MTWDPHKDRITKKIADILFDPKMDKLTAFQKALVVYEDAVFPELERIDQESTRLALVPTTSDLAN